MSDSLRPSGQQPTRLLCPWDSPGKNNGVGCHALLLTQGSNLNLLGLLHWQVVLYHQRHLGSPEESYHPLSVNTSNASCVTLDPDAAPLGNCPGSPVTAKKIMTNSEGFTVLSLSESSQYRMKPCFCVLALRVLLNLLIYQALLSFLKSLIFDLYFFLQKLKFLQNL